MNKTTLLALLAGVCFGAWPIFMQKSGLNGFTQAFVFSFILVVIVTPIAYFGHGDLTQIQWRMAVIAAIIGAFGTIIYTSAISKALTTQTSLATVILIQVVVQTVVPVVWEAIQTKTMPTTKLVGCMLAIATLVCLTKK